MYPLAPFFITLCAYGLICDSERLVAAGFVGAIYSHYFGFSLVPSLLLFYVRRYDGDWRRIAGRIALYVAAYAPWIAIAVQGMTFHAGRSAGPQGWAFHWLNLLRQLSLALLGGSLYSLFARCREKALQPALLPCALFLLWAPFLIPFQRYLVPFLPLLIVFGVAGLVGLFQFAVRRFRIENTAARAALAGLGLLALGVPNLEAYGIYPAMGRHLDLRDAVHAQEWDRIVAAIPSGRIATSNARSLIFYGNLRGLRTYEVVQQFEKNPVKFAALVEGGENDWIVVSKDPLYAELIPIADHAAHYQRAAEFDYTIVYQKAGR